MTAFAGAVLSAGTRDPSLTFAGVLPLATVLGALAGALAFAAIAADTLYVGLIFRAAVLRKDRLRSNHQPDHCRENGSAHLHLILVHKHPSSLVAFIASALDTSKQSCWIILRSLRIYSALLISNL
jgi:hypothetical protein